MATTTWDAVTPEVMIEVPELTQPMAELYVMLAAIEFCEKTRCWISDQGPIAVAPRVNEYAWRPAAGTQVVGPVLVWLNEVNLTPKMPRDLAARYGDYMQAEGQPAHFVQDIPSTLILVPTPVSRYTPGITAKLAVAPTRSSTGMDSAVLARYQTQIVGGALSRVLAMSKKPWTDQQAALLKREEFEAAMAKIKLQIQRSFASTPMRVPTQFM